MKKSFLTLVFWFIALLSFSQEGIKYNIRLECVYELEFDTVIFLGGPEHSMTIFTDFVVTSVNNSVFYDSIIDIKEAGHSITYTLKDNEGFIIFLTVLDEYIRLKLEIDPKMIYWYKILSYEKVH
jgi:hypothetical protein